MIMRETETAPIPGRETRIDKIQKNKWNTETGTFGAEAMIDKWDINIDTSYQRNISNKRVCEIAKNWRWEGIGRLVVGRRTDSRLFIVDGQHRLIAARSRSDVKGLPCTVFESSGPDRESELFLLLNTGRGPMTALEKFKAQLITGDPIAVSIKEEVDELGLEIPEKAGTRSKTGEGNTINCVASLIKAWRCNPNLAKKSLKLAKQITVDRVITYQLYDGIFLLSKKLEIAGENLFSYSEKLISAGYITVMDTIKKQSLILGYGGENVSASGILAVINKNKKNKLVVSGIA